MSSSNSTVINIQANIKDAKEKFKQLQEYSKSSLQAVAQSTSEVTQQQKKLNSIVDEHTRKLKELSKEQDKLNQLNEAGAKLSTLAPQQQKIREIKKEADALSKQITIENKLYASLKRKQRLQVEETNGLKKLLNEKSNEIKALKIEQQQKEQLAKQEEAQQNKLSELHKKAQDNIRKRRLELQKNSAEKKKALNLEREQVLSMTREGKAALTLKNKLLQLENARKKGIISSAEYLRIQAQLKQDMKEETAIRNSSFNTLVRHMRQIETMVFAMYGLSRAYQATIGKGVELNKSIENNSYGLAALIASNTELVDSQGKVLDSGDKFQESLKLSQDTMLKLKDASAKTAATFPELTSVFQQAIGFSLKMGSAFAKTTDEAIDRTIELTTTLTNMGSAIGMTPDLVLEETRSLFSGDISTDSKLGILLFGSPTQANQAIREAKAGVGKYANDVFGLLKSKLKDFSPLGEIDTYQRNLDQLKNAWDSTMLEMSEPVYKDMGETLKELKDFVVENQKEIVDGFKKFYDLAKSTLPLIKGIADAFIAYKSVTLLSRGFGYATDKIALMSAGMETLNDTFDIATKKSNGTVKNLSKIEKISLGLKNIGMFPNPFVGWLGGLIAVKEIFDYLIEKKEKYDVSISKDKNLASTSNSSKELKALSKKYNDLIKEENASMFTDTSKLKDYEAILKRIENRKLEISKSEKEVLQAKIKSISLNVKYNKKLKAELESKEKLTKIDKLNIKAYEKAIKTQEKQLKQLREQMKVASNAKGFNDIDSRKDRALKAKSNVDLTEIDKELQKTLDPQQQEIDAINKKYSDMIRKVKEVSKLDEYSLNISKAWEKDLNEINKKYQAQEDTLSSIQKIKDAIAKVNDPEKFELDQVNKKYDSYEKTLKKSDKTYDSSALEKAKAKEIAKIKEKYNKSTVKASLKDWQDYYIKLGDVNKAWEKRKEELSKKYGKEIPAKLLKQYKKEFIDKIEKDELSKIGDIQIDIENPFTPLIDSIKTMQKEQENYNSIANKTDKINAQHVNNQLAGYSNLAGAMAGFYDSESKQAQNLHKLQEALAAIRLARELKDVAISVTAFVTGETTKTAASTLTAIVSSMAGWPFPLNIAAGLATASFVDSLLGGSTAGKTTSSVNIKEDPNANTTVLGGGDEQSTSLDKSLDILADNVKPENALLSSMNKYLKSIDENTKGTATDIMRTGQFALGVDAVESSYENKGSLFGTGTFNTVFGLGGGRSKDYITLIESGLAFGTYDAQNKIQTDMWGRPLRTETVTDDGFKVNNKESNHSDVDNSQVEFTSQTLEDFIDNASVMMYQSLNHEHSSQDWKGSASYSYDSTTEYKYADDELTNSLQTTFANIRDSIVVGSEILGEDVENQLNTMTVDLSNVELTDEDGNALNGEELANKLNEAFSTEADNFTKELYGNSLDAFQQIGEGTYETLTRVSAGLTEGYDYIAKLGDEYEQIDYEDILNKSNSDVAFSVLQQSIEDTDEAIYGMNNGVVSMIDTFDGSAEELYDFYTALEDMRVSLEITGQDAANLNSSMILGADGIDNLASSMDDFYDSFLSDEEKLSADRTTLEDEFNKLHLSLPANAQGFKDLISSIDTTTEAGAELYGRTILLSESFANLTQEQEDYFNSTQDYTLTIASLQSEIRDEQEAKYEDELNFIKKIRDDLKDLKDGLGTTINDLLGNTTSADNQNRLIESYWEDYNRLQGYDLANLSEADYEIVSDILSDMENLAGNIQSTTFGDNTDITNNLVDNLESIKADIDFADTVLDVNIIGAEDGTFSELALSDTQKAQLEAFLEDGFISSDELATLSLSDDDRQNIEDTANRLGEDNNTNTTYDAITTMNSYLSQLLDVDDSLTVDDFMLSLGDMSAMSNSDQLALIQDGFTAQSDSTRIEEAQALTNDFATYLYSDDKTQYLEDLYNTDANRYDNVLELIDSLDATTSDVTDAIHDVNIQKFDDGVGSWDDISSYSDLSDNIGGWLDSGLIDFDTADSYLANNNQASFYDNNGNFLYNMGDYLYSLDDIQELIDAGDVESLGALDLSHLDSAFADDINDYLDANNASYDILLGFLDDLYRGIAEDGTSDWITDDLADQISDNISAFSSSGVISENSFNDFIQNGILDNTGYISSYTWDKDDIAGYLGFYDNIAYSFANANTAGTLAVLNSTDYNFDEDDFAIGSFSRGGFTYGSIDEIAGVVHGGEYVAPADQVEAYPELFRRLDNERTGYKNGGFVDLIPANNNIEKDDEIKEEFQKLNKRIEDIAKSNNYIAQNLKRYETERRVV